MINKNLVDKKLIVPILIVAGIILYSGMINTDD